MLSAGLEPTSLPHEVKHPATQQDSPGQLLLNAQVGSHLAVDSSLLPPQNSSRMVSHHLAASPLPLAETS